MRMREEEKFAHGIRGTHGKKTKEKDKEGIS
jgi:hypothetical protein